MTAPTDNKRITRELLYAAFIGPSRDTDDPRVLDRLIEGVEVQSLHPGDVLFREGDPAEDVHFMTEGRLRLTRAGVADWVYEGWWVIGTADALIGRRRVRTAVAETELHLFRLRSALWFEVNQNQPELLLQALVGFGRGMSRLAGELAPDGGFPKPSSSPLPVGVDTVANRLRLLSRLPLLRGISVQVLAELARGAEVRALAEGEPLFAPGAPRDRFVLVTRGVIELTLPEPAVTAQFGPGDVVAGLLHLGDSTDPWKDHARGPSEVLSFSVAELYDLLEENLESMKTLICTASLERERLCELLAERRGELVLR